MIIKAKTIFDHLSGIREKKVPWESLSESDKKSFTPYIVNRFISMNSEDIIFINEFQQYTIGILSPREVYKLYYSVLPEKKKFAKYIKNNSEKKFTPELLSYMTSWFQVSSSECIDYLELMSKDEVTTILEKYGLNKTQIKTILKNS